MTSPNGSSSSYKRQSSFLLLQGEDHPFPVAPKGNSALASLIRSRGSFTSSTHPTGPHDEESGAYGDDVDADEHNRARDHERRLSAILNGPHMRSMRLIGKNNPRYQWEKYWKTEEELSQMKRSIREYYERTNYLIQQYLYIDRLLDSSLPHDLLNEYNYMPASAFRGVEIPETISEEHNSHGTPSTESLRGSSPGGTVSGSGNGTPAGNRKVKRTPQDIYRHTETTPLLMLPEDDDGIDEVHDPDEETPLVQKHDIPWIEDDNVDSTAPIVTLAIYINFAANAILLAGKIAVIVTVPSVSVLASLVDAALDFLSTAIVWVTTWTITQQDQYRYPVGRRRLEPIGVLVFSIIMCTAFCQVALEAITRLMSGDHEVISLGIPAIAIMFSTIVIKGMCWLWCRLVKNSSVQALAADALTDVIFNAGSIAFPIAGSFLKIWWLDALGGLLLSLVVIINWSSNAGEHIKNLAGFSATADQRNILLYLTMRFAKTIKQIQGLQAYHSGDKLTVEVDIVLDASTSLKDSHDLAESLQYVIESVPIVDRAFVHTDYATYNLPTHMQQQS
ncbi:cation efflux family protein [Pyricularia oryzae 70-15]|uniref:Cation efflux family protein n=3 Tax=Pyricularia oryzae TaxID=318829 RepID=G4MRQ3_PYRO7|nr:cation efflux family protein [Pyricularia oryzae 70-15]EHA58268.1 cation efflux family protein [Pyricularia oryzae 70-15]ELQ39368.1 cation efflux family protein [Pyricularia oryzae Y34]KAI7925713.1 cation efflux family protein [Pyricularia oryzae]KAI7929315.1 cation efflux family protein [Pyricularia oryzae]